MRNRLLLIGFVMLFALIAANIGMAQTTVDDTFDVTATVAESCRITSVPDINFGAYDPTDPAPNDEAGSINLRCVRGTDYGTYITGTREMDSVTSGDTLTFELYSDAGHTTAYLDATPGITGTALSNAEITSDIYGRIAALQDVGVGADYTVTLTATVEY
jgi:spore coat protein U-like protein